MVTKKSLPVFAEELRMLNEAVSEDKPAGFWQWFTSDFWATAVTAVTNIVAVAAIIGWVDRENADSLTQALVALIGAAEVIALNSALVWKYLSGRQAERAQMLSARMHYMETIAVERMRLAQKS
jgi:hypothetical protein